ncbi:hypothetical protein HMPREF3212_02222 [Citrobacter freundii]|nr:hypothetical protein CUC52_15120 [Citrobacter freundii]KWZ91066.1 hypothetical protein HMPREF3212_02222 [Citrobacter freundii]CAE7268428.1 hypothetical protein AI2609V1_1058 [Citrobacter freundii]CAH3470668.1 hypothetical protein AI2609V1_1058 [Citrobacter freundii]
MKTHPDYIYIFIYAAIMILILIISIWREWYKLDKRNLYHQKLFWLSILLPVFSFFFFGYFAWSGKTPVLNAHGYYRFYEISKFPLLLLASSVPLASIVNNIHRTIQTEAQIQAADSKNAIDRHFAHEKNFIEKINHLSTFTILNLSNNDGKIISSIATSNEKIATTDQIKITNPYLLYKKIYPNSATHILSNFEPNSKFLEEIEILLKDINNSLKPRELDPENKPLEYLRIINSVSNKIVIIFEKLCIDNIMRARYKISIKGNSIITFAHEENSFLEFVEASIYLTRKIKTIIYSAELAPYEHIVNYIYETDFRFHFDKYIRLDCPIYSPHWDKYTTPDVTVVPNGGKMATKKFNEVKMPNTD